MSYQNEYLDLDDENNIHSKIDPEKFENASYFLGVSKENLTIMNIY